MILIPLVTLIVSALAVFILIAGEPNLHMFYFIEKTFPDSDYPTYGSSNHLHSPAGKTVYGEDKKRTLC